MRRKARRSILRQYLYAAILAEHKARMAYAAAKMAVVESADLRTCPQ